MYLVINEMGVCILQTTSNIRGLQSNTIALLKLVPPFERTMWSGIEKYRQRKGDRGTVEDAYR